MTETVIITGRDLGVEHQADDDRPAAGQPIRPRPAPYTPPADTGQNLKLFIGQPNLYWADEANEWAEAHPEVRPKDAARKWRKHRIETT